MRTVGIKRHNQIRLSHRDISTQTHSTVVTTENTFHLGESGHVTVSLKPSRVVGIPAMSHFTRVGCILLSTIECNKNLKQTACILTNFIRPQLQKNQQVTSKHRSNVQFFLE